MTPRSFSNRRTFLKTTAVAAAAAGSSSASSLHTATRKKVSVFAVALLCFSCVAGGPFGIEVAVQAGGKDFESLMFERVFRPLGLKSAGWGRPWSAARSFTVSGAVQSGGGGGNRASSPSTVNLDTPERAAALAGYDVVADVVMRAEGVPRG